MKFGNLNLHLLRLFDEIVVAAAAAAGLPLLFHFAQWPLPTSGLALPVSFGQTPKPVQHLSLKLRVLFAELHLRSVLLEGLKQLNGSGEAWIVAAVVALLGPAVAALPKQPNQLLTLNLVRMWVYRSTCDPEIEKRWQSFYLKVLCRSRC